MTAPKEISNTDDSIDSRDIIEQISYLQSLEDEIDEEDKEELAKLKELASQCENYTGWENDATLIRGSSFTEYAEEFARDIGAISSDAQWPLLYIDWDSAAEELKTDFTEVDFDGVSYYMR